MTLRDALQKFLPVVISVGLLALLFSKIDLAAVYGIFQQLGLGALALAVALTAIYYAAGAARLVWLLRPMTRIPHLEATRLIFASGFSAHLLGIISDGLRIGYLALRHNITWKQSFSANLADRILSVLILGLAVLLFWPEKYGGLTAPLVGTALIAGLVTAGRLKYSPDPTAVIGQTSGLLINAVQPAQFLRQIALGALGIVAIAAALRILAHSMSIELSFIDALPAAAVLLLGSIVPFTYAGLGFRESVAAVVLPAISSATQEQAIAISLGLAICFFVACLPGAAFLPSFLKLRIKQAPS